MTMPVMIHGTLMPDGTVQLDQKPNLPPGPVLVSVQPLPQSPAPRRGLADVIDEIRQSQRARGYHGRTVQEMEAEEAERQREEEEYEARWEALRGETKSGGPGAGS